MSETLANNILDTIKLIGPAVILPICILWLTNRQTRKNKALDNEFELSKLTESRKIDQSFNIDNEKKNHEKTVHSCLVKILFEIQNLHISLSGNCVDFKCVNDALKEFRDSFKKYQHIISENQIYLSSKVTNHLYSFYNLLAELLTELKDIQDQKNYDIAIVSVNEYSGQLANEIIEIQDLFIKQREDLAAEFNKIELTEFSKCCGYQPSKELRDKYYKLKIKIDNLQEPIEGGIEKQKK